MTHALTVLDKFYPVDNVAPAVVVEEDERPQPKAFYGNSGMYNNVYTAPYDGQNSLGEMGPAVRYVVDHGALAIRSWQLYLESANYKTILKKLADTVIGSGLKLQSNPVDRYLSKKHITLDREVFTETVEDLWNIYATSTMADYADKDTLGKLHFRGYANAVASGDVLVILRPVNNVVKVQLVDGVHVQTPINFGFATESKINYEPIERINPDTGNRVRWGIEIDATGKHVAYHVRVGLGLTYERVLARGPKSGALMAYMLTDEEYRIDNLRGLPRMAAGMETASQHMRYVSATVSAAEERAKAPYYIEHELGSSGEDPRLKSMTKAYDVDRPANNQLDYSAEGKTIANTVAVSMNRTVANMPPGSGIKTVDTKNDLHFEPFNKAITEQQAALAGIPPEIVASKFDSNFSASRAAFLAEGMRLNREWTEQGNHFLQPILNLQLDIWVQMFEVDAPGYLEALQTKNQYVLNAYRKCSWEGDKLGHIDPMKEINYWRAILGDSAKGIPLGTAEQAAAALGTGDAKANMSQYAKELAKSDELGIPREDGLTVDEEEEEETEEGADAPTKKKPAKTKPKKK